MNVIKKKIKLKEDSRNYVTKITLGDKGDIEDMKVRRTVGGFLRGAPRVSKAEAQATSSYKKGGSVGTSKKTKMKTGDSLKPVAANQKGLAKLPTAVRNKMGFKKLGGVIDPPKQNPNDSTSYYKQRADIALKNLATGDLRNFGTNLKDFTEKQSKYKSYTRKNKPGYDAEGKSNFGKLLGINYKRLGGTTSKMKIGRTTKSKK